MSWTKPRNSPHIHITSPPRTAPPPARAGCGTARPRPRPSPRTAVWSESYEPAGQVRFEVETPPDPPDRGPVQPDAFGHRNPRPVGGTRRHLVEGEGDHLLHLIEQDRGRSARARFVGQAGQPVLDEAFTPLGHRRAPTHPDPVAPWVLNAFGSAHPSTIWQRSAYAQGAAGGVGCCDWRPPGAPFLVQSDRQRWAWPFSLRPAARWRWSSLSVGTAFARVAAPLRSTHTARSADREVGRDCKLAAVGGGVVGAAMCAGPRRGFEPARQLWTGPRLSGSDRTGGHGRVELACSESTLHAGSMGRRTPDYARVSCGRAARRPGNRWTMCGR